MSVCRSERIANPSISVDRKQDSSSSADTGHTDIPGMVLRRPDSYTPPPAALVHQLRSMAPVSDRPVSLGSPPIHRVDLKVPTLPRAYPGAGVHPPGTDIEMQPLGMDRGESSLNTSTSTHG